MKNIYTTHLTFDTNTHSLLILYFPMRLIPMFCNIFTSWHLIVFRKAHSLEIVHYTSEIFWETFDSDKVYHTLDLVLEIIYHSPDTFLKQDYETLDTFFSLLETPSRDFGNARFWKMFTTSLTLLLWY